MNLSEQYMNMSEEVRIKKDFSLLESKNTRPMNESTNANIGIEGKDGKVKDIYLHWDGDTSWAGEILLKHYKTAKRVNELIKLGNLSILGKDIGEKVDFDDRSTHKKDQCIAYGRDRGEKDYKAQTSKNKSEIIDANEYVYVYQTSEKRWIYSADGSTWLDLATKKPIAGSSLVSIKVAIYKDGKRETDEMDFGTRAELDSWLDKEFK